MIIIKRKAIRDGKYFIIWKYSKWKTGFFQRTMGRTIRRRAKLIFNLPFGAGLFWTFGKNWIE